MMRKILIQKAGVYHYSLHSNQRAQIFILKNSNSQKPIKCNVNLSGENSQVDVYQLQIGLRQQKHQTTCNIFHLAPKTKSRVSVRGVLHDQAQAYFDGLIKIDETATNADSFMEYRTLLLSDQAQVFPTPSLEIKNNEVKASHAATVSTISENELIYLQSRGIKQKQAEKILITSFIEKILTHFPTRLINSVK